jgi:hypothetical protein
MHVGRSTQIRNYNVKNQKLGSSEADEDFEYSESDEE